MSHYVHNSTSFTAFFCPLLTLLNTPLLLVQTFCLKHLSQYGRYVHQHAHVHTQCCWWRKCERWKTGRLKWPVQTRREAHRVGVNSIMCTFLHISIQNLIKQLLLDSRWQVLYICKDMQDINFSCSLKPNGTRHWGQQRGYSDDTQRGCSVAMPFTGWHFVNGTL